jgi:hypothetical protein
MGGKITLQRVKFIKENAFRPQPFQGYECDMAPGKLPAMIELRLLGRAALIGAVLQLILAVWGHASPWVALNLLTFGRMMLSATAGYIYGIVLGRSYAAAILGGMVAGGLAAIPALLLSVFLSDSPAAALAVETGICILTGGVGGAFGQMGALMKKLGF